MAKLFSKMKIIRTNKDGVEEVIKKQTVFDATATEAKQFDALGSARPATEAEIKAHAERQALDDGLTFQNPAPSDAVLQAPAPDSGAAGDPKSSPKGKNS